MDEKELDALIFAIEQKADHSSKEIYSSFGGKFEQFHKGQFQAYSEILSMLNRNSND